MLPYTTLSAVLIANNATAAATVAETQCGPLVPACFGNALHLLEFHAESAIP